MRTRELISPLLIHTVPSCVVILAACAGAWGCSSYKNYDERLAAAGIQDTCNCIDTCQPDPGSRPVDIETTSRGMTFAPYCDRATQGLTFLEPFVATFEGSVARYFYTYQDDSTRFFDPTALGDDDYATEQKGYEADAAPGGPCNDSRFAMHLYGGPFRSWGGGFGMSTRNIYDRDCRNSDDPPSYCPEPGTEFAEEVLDLSEFEGISFWARRGPDGQSGIRVMAGDKRVDDDLSFLSKVAAAAEQNPENTPYSPDYPTPLYCERKKECGCTNHKPCTKFTQEMHQRGDGIEYCFDPDAGDPFPGDRDECGRIIRYDVCGQSKCDEGFPAWEDWRDPQFNGRECVPYAFPGSVYGDYCYDPGVDPDPPDNQFLCGDYWFDEVLLTTDWEFFAVPFTDMHQQGWAMESFEFDTSAISVIRFTWNRGWLDLWIDDVTFYKREP